MLICQINSLGYDSIVTDWFFHQQINESDLFLFAGSSLSLFYWRLEKVIIVQQTNRISSCCFIWCYIGLLWIYLLTYPLYKLSVPGDLFLEVIAFIFQIPLSYGPLIVASTRSPLVSRLLGNFGYYFYFRKIFHITDWLFSWFTFTSASTVSESLIFWSDFLG